MPERRTLRIASVAILLIFASGLLMPAANVHASTVGITYPRPSWWTGTSDCWSDYYNANNGDESDAVLLTTWRGIQVCGPRPQEHNGFHVEESIPNVSGSGSYTAYMFECTELATRYLRIAYGLNGIPVGGGSNFATAYANAYPSTLQHFYNGVDNVLPQEGDVVSFTSSDPNGHAAIVSQLSETSPGNGTLTFVDQNGDPAESPAGTFQMSIVDYVIQDTGVFHATDWIHPWWSVMSPTADYATITGIAASDPSDVWIVGWEQLPQKTMQPITYHFNGSEWTKFMPPKQDISSPHYLQAATVDPTGDAWIVGYWNYGTDTTLAYHWNGSAWIKVQSDNPSPSNNRLYNVTTDGAGNIYAVGNYFVSGVGYKPIIEKWNGTKFANQNVSLPPGASTAQVYDISFSSPSNGWAVAGYTVYHSDGSVWTPTLQTFALSSVVAISDTEAWATGKNASGIQSVFHYTPGGWQEIDTGISYPSPFSYKAVKANSPTSVWVVGSYANPYFHPISMFYDGAGWTQVTTWPDNLRMVDLDVSPTNSWALGTSTRVFSH